MFDVLSFFTGFIITVSIIGNSPLIIKLLERNIKHSFIEKKFFEDAKFWVPLGIIYSACLGLLVWLLPHDIAIPIVALSVLVGFYSIWSQFKSSKIPFLLTLPILIWGVIFFHTSSEKPTILRDGPYVSKEWNLASNIQYLLLDLPCDNVLPYIITEFLVNKIPFKANNPILPNQPVTNRGVITSLVSTPALLIVGGEQNRVYRGKKLPEFKYVNTNWPDTFVLYSDRNFSIFLGAFFAISFSFLLAIFSILHSKHSKETLLGFTLLLFSNYYILSQLTFTWPKIFLGFLAILIYENHFHDKNVGYALFLIALGILFHPNGYFLAIIWCVLAYWQFGLRYKSLLLKMFAKDSVLFLLIAIVAYTAMQLIYLLSDIPSNMLSQNNLDHFSLLKWGSIKIKSLLISLPYPINKNFLHSGWITYTGSLLIISLPIIYLNIKSWFKLNTTIIIWIILSSIPFGFPAPTMLLGMQVIIPLGILMVAKEYQNWKYIYCGYILQTTLFIMYSYSLSSLSKIEKKMFVLWTSFPFMLLLLCLVIAFIFLPKKTYQNRRACRTS